MSLLEKDKRKFSVIIGSKKCGACSGASPSGAARKVKGKSGAFYLKETTKGSKKKLYGPYSSKKRVVQRGGTFEDRKDICKKVLERFLEYHKNDIDDNMHSVKKAFEVFGIHGYKKNNLLYKLIECRRNIQDPIFSTLISSGGITLTEAEIEKEAAFYDNSEYKKNIGDFLTKKNWVNFINYLKVHIRMIEIRQNVCSEIAHLLENCNSRKMYTSKESVLLNMSFTSLEINEHGDKYYILKQIIFLRNIGDEQCFFNILFSDYNFAEEQKFINENIVQIGQYLERIERGKLPNKSTVENLKKIITPLWIKFLKNLRETRVIWEEEEKLKLQTEERNNEVQRAKANFQARMGKSNLGSPAEEEYEIYKGKPLPNYLLDIYKKNTSVEAGPAEETNNYRPPPNLLRAVKRQVNQKPKQPSRNNKNAVPANVNNTPQSRKNLLEKLAALLEND
jgi:hypothetical protein